MEKIKELVAQARVKEAVEMLLAQAPPRFRNDIILLQTRLNKLKRDEMMGIIGHANANLERNKITVAVLGMINDVETELIKRKQNSNPASTNPNPQQPAPTGKKIFFSYAWGINADTGENREAIVDQLYESLEADGEYQLVRDKKDAGYKKSIVDFMEEIGRGENIIVVINDKYLKSPNCMFELMQIYKRSGSDEKEFIKRIFPIILGDANFYKPKDILRYVKFWKTEVKDLEEAINDVGIQDARAVFDDFDKIVEIKNYVGKLATILKSINTLNPKVLSADNFLEIKKTIAGKH
ncbi:MAG: TIR domain-containing protein [Bacteroidota bacterium]